MADTNERQRTPTGPPPRPPAEGRPRPPGPEDPRGTTATGGPTGPRPPSIGDTLRSPRFWIMLLALVAINWLVAPLIFPDGGDRLRISYTVFRTQVEAGNVAEITSRGDTVQGLFKTAVTDPAPTPGQTPRVSTKFDTNIPSFIDGEALGRLLEEKGVVINARPLEEARSLLLTILISFGPALLLIFAFLWLSSRAQQAGGRMFGLGQSRAKLYEANTAQSPITFADVAGIDEVEAELVEVVDFLRNPQKYQRLGGTIPKGVLLIGPPGTGKTLLARAVAGEAGAPFFSMSGSEFVEMIVGVGASRVRDLFAKAKAAAPAIVFIDELDAIGRRRGGGGLVGGNDEREQTLNQMLVEMDGFDGRTGVIVLAATNRADVLDPALLRPGRFDRRVVVQPPDRAGRAEILRVHTRGVPLADDVDLVRIAAETPGLVGADLRNLVNEAALLAAREGHATVHRADFANALEKIALGAERKIVLSPEDRRRIGYHEAGHALLGLLQPEGDPVRRVTVVPRGQALGVTLSVPEADRYNFGEAYLRARIVTALGGRAAEQVVYGNVTTGAENDLRQVTGLARAMVTRWGMSADVGQVSLAGREDGNFLDGGDASFGPRAYSEATAEAADHAVRRIIDESYATALDLLTRERPRLEALTEVLLRDESLDERQILDATGLVGHRGPVNPIAAER